MNELSRLQHALTEGAIGKTLFFFSLPILAGNVLQSLNGSINAIWVGRYLGEAALTATSNANTILFFLLGVVFGIGMAATIMIGQSIGANNPAQAKRIVGTSASFFVFMSILVALLGFIFSPTLLAWMHTPADATPYAIRYLRIIFLAIPFIYAYAFVMMTLRGAGDAKTPFLFLLLSVGLDIVLNPVLIFGVGPIPAMGIAGSAAATLIAQATSLIAIMVHLYSRKHFLCLYRHELHLLRIDRDILHALVSKGGVMGLQMIVISLSMIVMISFVNRFGSQVTAAFGAAMQVWNYIQMPSIALGVAAASMAAQNVGAHRWDRVRHTALVGVGFNFLMTGSLVVLIYLFNRGMFSLFLPHDDNSIVIAQHLNAIVVWSFLFFGVSMVLFGIVRSTGAVFAPLAILFFSLWVVRIPFALTFLERWQADAIWWSFPIGSLICMVFSIAYYRYGGWQSAHMLKPHSDTNDTTLSDTAPMAKFRI